MIIRVNGEQHAVSGGATVASLIDDLQLQHRFAVEINQVIVPRSCYGERFLRTGDQVEIVRAVGGG